LNHKYLIIFSLEEILRNSIKRTNNWKNVQADLTSQMIENDRIIKEHNELAENIKQQMTDAKEMIRKSELSQRQLQNIVQRTELAMKKLVQDDAKLEQAMTKIATVGLTTSGSTTPRPILKRPANDGGLVTGPAAKKPKKSVKFSSAQLSLFEVEQTTGTVVPESVSYTFYSLPEITNLFIVLNGEN